LDEDFVLDAGFDVDAVDFDLEADFDGVVDAV
jgi:hypothetical protein